MKCPKCGGNTRIVDVRQKTNGDERRRACCQCGCTFITAEQKIRECRKYGKNPKRIK